MNATLARKLRFSDVVYAIGTTPKSLRLWLQRGVVQIHTPKPEGGGWTEYSFIDIALLALVRSLVTFGVDVPTASAIANKIMSDHFFPHMSLLQKPGNMPAGALAVMWTNRRLYLFRDGDDWEMRLVNLWEAKDEPAPVFLSLNIEAVLRTAFERAEESVNEGATDEDGE